MFNLKVVTLALFASAGLFGSAFAQEGHALTVVDTDGDQHVLSLDKLDAMEQVEFSTTTIWTEGIFRFSGVPLTHLLESLKAEGSTLRMSALNDYSVEMPTSELENDAPIVATRINGQTLPVREKGPYWVVYPFDRSPEYRTEAKYSQSIWQLKTLAVME